MITNTVYDPGGDNDGRLDPGETAVFTVTLKNVGGMDFTELITIIQSLDIYVNVTDNSGNFGSITVGNSAENTGDPYVVHANAGTPIGHRAAFRLVATATEGSFVDTFSFNLMVGGYDYLVWNPDPTPSSGETVDNLLTTLGFAGEYATTLDTKIDLDIYEAIFVCVGVRPDKYVIGHQSEEALALEDYITRGGRVYLEGGDVWCYDPFYGGHNFGPCFEIRYVSDGADDMGPVVGQSSMFTEGMSFGYDGENSSMDRISPLGSAFAILEDGDDYYYCGVANDTCMYRTVGVSFQLGDLVDSSSTKQELLGAIMDFFEIHLTGVGESTDEVAVAPMLEIFPSVFRDRINISYRIGHSAERMELRIFDVTGRLVRDLSCCTLNALSPVHVFWNGTDSRGQKLPSGVYFIRLQTGTVEITKSIVLVR